MIQRIAVGLVVVVALIMTSCSNLRDYKTSIEVVDNGRHYYPILVGQELEVTYFIKNIGEHPLIIDDIITSCGCLILSESIIKSIPPNEEGVLKLIYNSNKNVGYVKHYIGLYGNFVGHAVEELTFDVNVVPNALYTEDYEELYLQEKKEKGNIKGVVDGAELNKVYFMDPA